jgi:protoporphyrinogen oxidase
LEFLSAVIKYQNEAIELYPFPMKIARPRARGASISQTSPPFLYADKIMDNEIYSNGMAEKPESFSQEKFESKLDAIKKRLDLIIQNFVKPNAPKEANITAPIRKILLKNFEDGIYHPDILNLSYDHVANTLRLNTLNQFLQESFEISKANAILEG